VKKSGKISIFARNLTSMRKNNPSTTYRQDLRQRIMRAAMQSFRKMGIKSVRMDDLANKLSISKRTLYEIYNNKEDLLLECLKNHKEEMEKRIHSLVTEDSSAMDFLLVYLRLEAEDNAHTNPVFYYELEKYPKVKVYLESNHELRREMSLVIMRRGVDEGDFRKDVNYDLVNIMVESFMNYIMKSEVYRNLPLTTIVKNLLLVVLRGICTDQGLKRLKDLDVFSSEVRSER